MVLPPADRRTVEMNTRTESFVLSFAVLILGGCALFFSEDYRALDAAPGWPLDGTKMAVHSDHDSWT